ncbi:MAG: hypothetical protein QME32_03680, partial [Endomicrobiia bacterium]|nr:hypothetical protein [Endomicrobiia bacterium]
GHATNHMAVEFSWDASADGGFRGNSGVKGYELLVATSVDFATLNRSSVTAAIVYMSTPFTQGLYYWRVRAADNAGNYSSPSGYYSLAIDTASPIVSDLQAGDTTWQNIGGKFYSVYFHDAGFAQVGLDTIEYAVSTSPLAALPFLIGWTDIATPPIGSPSHVSDWQVSFGPLLENVTNYVSVRARDLVGNATVFFDAFYIKKDVTNPEIIDEQSGDDVWRKELKSDGYAVAFQDGGGSLLDYAQYRAAKYLGGGTTEYPIAWTYIFASSNIAQYPGNWNVNFPALTEGINHIIVRVFDNANNSQSVITYPQPFYVKKDTTPPSCVSNQAGDDVWRVANDGFYNVDFADAGSGSGVSKVEIIVSTSPASGGNPGQPALIGWSAAFSTETYTYTDEWPLPEDVWAAIPSSGRKNRVSVRAIDFAYNTSTILTDAFYVMKDTVAPRIVNQQSGDDTWRRFGGTAYNVDFADDESLLRGAEYIVRNGPNPLDTPWPAGWTRIFASTGAADYNADWPVDFANLSEGVNYVFVRSSDGAGLWNVPGAPSFYVKKDISNPTITDNQDGDFAWRNSSGAAYGVFFQDAVSGVTTAQYQIKDPQSNTVVDWTNIFGGTTAYVNYNSSWSVSAAAFNALPEGTTGNVYVRCFDAAGNSASPGAPLFFILKDTNPPYCVVNQNDYVYSHPDWFADVDFYDRVTAGREPGSSNLANARYAVYSSTGLTGDVILGWGDIAGFIPGATFYTDNWKINFNALPENVTSYVSVRAVDLAGNTSTYIDAFRVVRTTSSVPIIISNVVGDYAWYASSATFLQKKYDVDFNVGQTAFLSTMSVTARTGLLGSGEQLLSETIVITTSNVTSHDDDWYVKPSTFTPDHYIWDAMREGVNYVSVTAYDTLNSSSTLYDAFFVRKDTTAPPVSILLDPINNSATNFLSVNFRWQSSNDLTSGTTGYFLEISEQQDFSTVLFSSVTSLVTAPMPLSGEATYYWRVRAQDAAGNYSAFPSAYKVWLDTTPPSAPALISPSSGTVSNVTSRVFSWSSSADSFSGILNYTLQLSTAVNFAPLAFSSTTADISSNLSSRQNLYYWRVRTLDRAGNVNVSTEAFVLRVDTTPPSVPVLQNPVNGAATNYTNVTFQWDAADDSGFRGNSGLDGYEFYISTTSDFSVWTSSAFTLSLSHLVTLSQDFYHWRVRSRDNAVNFSTFTSAFTLTVDTSPPAIYNYQSGDEQWRNNSGATYNVDFEDKLSKLHTVQYAVYSSTDADAGTLIKDWTNISAGINAESYATDFPVAFAEFPEATTCYVSVRAWDNLLQYSTFYNVFYVLKDITRPAITDGQSGDDTWRKAAGNVYSVYFEDAGGAKLQKFETRIMSGPSGGGNEIQAWAQSDTIISGATYYNAPWPLNASAWPSLPEGKSYVSARVFDNSYSPDMGHNSDSLTDAFYILKDTTPPVVQNNQSGDAAWRNSNYAAYDVDFKDATSGSGIKSFEVIASTVATLDGGGAPAYPLISWMAVVSTDTYSYTQNWTLPTEVWDSLIRGVTNYVSVRASDFADNVSTSANVFFVLKDTIPPVIQNEQTGDAVWRRLNDGVYAVRFFDEGGSKLNKFQIRASTAGYGAAPFAFDWTDSGVVVAGATFYVENWQLSSSAWQLLLPGTNYISVRVADFAASTTTLANAFYILKDTQPPVGVAVAPAYSSTETFNVPYTAQDYGASGIKNVKLYYTLQTEPPHTYTLYATTTANPVSFTVSGEGRYGFRIVVYDNALNSDEPDPPDATSSPESQTLVDITAPTVNDQQTGDDLWRNTAKPDGYSVYFNDSGSGLDSAQYIIRSGPSAGDTVLKNWTYIFQSSAVAAYNQNWGVDFGACKSSWNYVSTRVWDIAGRTTTLDNVFYVKKDTEASVVSYSEFASGGDNTWRDAARAGGYDVDFYDGLSLLSKAEYAVHNTSVAADVNPPNILSWQTIETAISSPSYTTNWSVLFTPLVEATTNFVHVRLTDIAGNAATYYAFHILKDTSAPSVANYETGQDPSWRMVSRNYDIRFYDYKSRLDTIQYRAYISTAGINPATTFWQNIVPSPVSAAEYTAPFPVIFSLLQNGTNYIAIRAADLAGNTTIQFDRFRVLRDNLPPSIADNQPGDDIWRNSNVATYDVDFGDTLSGMTTAEYRIYPLTGMSGDPLTAWTTIYAGIAVSSYTTNWSLLPSHFSLLPEGIGYVSVRCFDAVGNSSTTADVFYIRKDTTTPTITDNEADDETWYSTGRAYDVRFYDYTSLLNNAEYAAYSSGYQSGTQILGWTQIFNNQNSSSHETPWTPSFAALAQGYNYISARSYDYAGNVSTAGVFHVKKDTAPPSQITNLAAATGASEGEINLSWSAPSDPAPGSGTQKYIVKFATFVIAESGFASDANVRTFVQGWAPKTPGVFESGNVISGLSQGRAYYAAVKTQDVAGNVSLAAVSNEAQSKADITAPNAITDLTAAQGDYMGQIKISWSAPGDNGTAGNLVGNYSEGDEYAGYYTIRYW